MKRKVIVLILIIFVVFYIPVASGQKNIIDAVERNEVKEVQTLLEGNPSLLHTWTREGESLLHIAAKMGYADMVTLLLEYKMEINIRDKQKNKTHRQNRLHWARERKRPQSFFVWLKTCLLETVKSG